MKIYVAGKFEEAGRVRKVQNALIDAGHEITYDWTIGEAFAEDDPRAVDVAFDELEAAMDCDVFVILPHERSKGAYVEMGAALAADAQVYVLDPEEASRKWTVFFQHIGVAYVHSISELLTAIENLE